MQNNVAQELCEIVSWTTNLSDKIEKDNIHKRVATH